MRPTAAPPPCPPEALVDDSRLSEEQMAKTAKALAHPERIRILELFASGGPRIAGDIVAHSTLAQSTVSEHLRILREAGILVAQKDGPRTWYCMSRLGLSAFANAVSDMAEKRRRASVA